MKNTAWGKSNVVKFYNNNRKNSKDLYLSEKKLLLKINKNKIKSILDFGCASGNFYKIFKSLYGKINYMGIDFDPLMIKSARKIHSRNKNFVKFKVDKEIKRVPKYDLVFATGVLNHIKNYKKIVNQMIKNSGKYVFFDAPRLHFKSAQIAKMNLSKRFEDKRKSNFVKYYIENVKSFVLFVKNILKNNNCEIYIFSNNLPYSKKYLNIKTKIFFCTVLIVKNSKSKLSIYTKNKKIKNSFNEKI